MKKLAILIILFCLIVNIALGKSLVRAIFLRKCPVRTLTFEDSIVFVGKLNDLGNDKFTEVWFELGKQRNYLDKQTNSIKLNKPGIFCLRVNRLKKCENYYYRAIAKNSKGVSYGEVKNIKTRCK